MRDVKLHLTLLVFGLSFSGCVSVPDHEICQLDIPRNRSYCARVSAPDKVRIRPLSELDKYIARSIDDEQKVVEWIKRNCKQK